MSKYDSELHVHAMLQLNHDHTTVEYGVINLKVTATIAR